jgi:hypothetical protein
LNNYKFKQALAERGYTDPYGDDIEEGTVVSVKASGRYAGSSIGGKTYVFRGGNWYQVKTGN